MNFEIDVSGSDIFARNYTIVAASKEKNNFILAYKFDEKIVSIIRAKHGQKKYRYFNSKKGTVDLKIRLYCTAIFYLFMELQKRFKLKEVQLDVCRDFSGNEADIKQSLLHLLEKKIGLTVSIFFTKLSRESIANNYAYLIKQDKGDKMKKYSVKISLEQFEQFLIK